MAEFDDSASACAIDALSIISKRSSSSTEPFLDLQNEEVNQLIKSIRSGDASRNDLEEASSLNVLWCGVILVLQSNIYFIGNEDVMAIAAKLPVHVQRFFGALFSTFETLMEHQRDNSPYLVKSLVLCVQPNLNNTSAMIVQMVRDYKSLFSYSYMFNRRTGVIPTSQLEHVVDYFKRVGSNMAISTTDGGSASSQLLLEDDNDSYDGMMRASTDRMMAPKYNAPSSISRHLHHDNVIAHNRSNNELIAPPHFSAPSVMPLRPVKLLSDDEHYGSDYQPAAASDLETDLLYNKHHAHSHTQAQGAVGADQQHLALMNDDSMFSMDGGSILNSYYKYNGWNNSVEEDEDSGDDHYQPPVPAPRTKRLTRMRQQQQVDTAASGKPKKVKKRRSQREPKRDPQGQRSTGPIGDASIGAAPRIATRFRSGSQDVAEDSGSHLSSPEESTGMRKAWRSRQATDEDVESSSASASDAESGGSRDEESDPSELSAPRAPAVMNATQSRGDASSSSWRQQDRARNAPPPKPAHVDSVEVEDFEPFEEDYGSQRRVATKPSDAFAAATEAHSPSSVGSSIELSDRERRGGRAGQARAAKDTRTQPSRYESRGNEKPSSAAAFSTTGTVRGRGQTALSGEASDEENLKDDGLMWHRRDASSSAPTRRGNPLDASIEAQGLGVTPVATVVRPRNPLDASLEELPRQGAISSSSSSNWVTAASSTRGSVARAPPAPARSVVRMPSASPSKADQSRNRRMATEGDVDLVADWDSPEDSGSGAEEAKRHQHQHQQHTQHQRASAPEPAHVPADRARDQPLAAPSFSILPPRDFTSFRDPHQYGSDHQPALPPSNHHPAPEPHSEYSRSAAHADNIEAPAPPSRASQHGVDEDTFGHARADVHAEKHRTASKGAAYTSDERAAAIEKMKANIAKQKREKELAITASAATATTHTKHQPLHPPHHTQQQQQQQSAHTVFPVSILRKSVTFEDQRAKPSQADAYTPAVAGPAASITGFSLQAPSPRGAGGASQMRGSVDDMVLYGSRQASLTSFDAPSSSEASPVPAERGVAASSALEHGDKPPTMPHLALSPHPSARQDSPGHVTVHQAPLDPQPRLSRVPSEQLLLPPRRPASHSHSHSAAQSMVSPAEVNPRHSFSSAQSPRVPLDRQFSSSSLALSTSTSSRPAPTLPDHFQPPPLSEYAQSSGIILEGYLHKKSAGILGQWQKRYFVLSESTTCLCVLRIYTRAVVTAWGSVAVGLRASIPIFSIESVDTVSTPAAKGKEFVIKFTPRSSSGSASSKAGESGGGGSSNSSSSNRDPSEAGSVFSDAMLGPGDTKVTTIMADDAETRLLWVTMLQRALAVAQDENAEI